MSFLSTHLNVEAQEVLVLPRLSPRGKDWRQGKNAHDYGNAEQELLLFLPYDWVNRGRIGYWTPNGGHGEAALDYYWATKPPHSRAIEADALVEQYRRVLASLRVPYTLRRVQRLPSDWRDHAWQQS